MKLFIEGVDRMQGTLFPVQLEEYMAEDNCAFGRIGTSLISPS